MPAPQGDLYEVKLKDGTEVTLLIEPTIYSRRSIDALNKLYRTKVRDNVWEELRLLSESTLPAELRAEMRAEYMAILKKSAMPGFTEATEALQSPEGLIIALEVNGNTTRDTAAKVVNDADSLLDLMKRVMSIGSEEMEAAKN